MDYLEFTFLINPPEPGTEILIAYLGQCGFESFYRDNETLKAYLPQDDFDEAIFYSLPVWENPEFTIEYQQKLIKRQNWNSSWEANFDPIWVDETCVVRAPFHPPTKVAYDLVIAPNMSFGTGHHETTQLMLQWILQTDMEGKSVLDVGCGTGVLGILAALRGATAVTCIDTDPICVENTLENAQINQCSQIKALEGDITIMEGVPASDIIIANINKNVLLNHLPYYSQFLTKGGNLFLSGFYKEDLKEINDACRNAGVSFEKKMVKNNWVSSKYVF